MTIGTIIIIILLMMLTSFSTYILTKYSPGELIKKDDKLDIFGIIAAVTIGIDVIIICLLIMRSIFWLILNWNLPI